MEGDTEGGRETRRLRERGRGVYARKRSFLNRCLHCFIVCVYKAVHTEEHFTRLPSVLFNPVVVLSCLGNLSCFCYIYEAG